MEIINQLATPLAQSVNVARQQSVEKTQQAQRAYTVRKDVAASGDTFEHQVESAEETSPVHDEQKRQSGEQSRPPKRQPNSKSAGDSKDDVPHVDLTA